MLVLRTSNFQWSSIGPIVSKYKHLLSLLFTTNFSSARQFKNHVKLFSTFLEVKFEKENRQKTLNAISIVYFL